jgi:hypothetical protein
MRPPPGDGAEDVRDKIKKKDKNVKEKERKYGTDSLSVELEQTRAVMNMLRIIVFVYGLVSGVSCIVERRMIGRLARKWDKTVTA